MSMGDTSDSTSEDDRQTISARNVEMDHGTVEMDNFFFNDDSLFLTPLPPEPLIVQNK